MDAHGMEMMLLSLNAPTVQAMPDPKKAGDVARRANDYLAEKVAKHPTRFQAFAAVPLQDPEAASRELLPSSICRERGWRKPPAGVHR